jgi:hypothetical protein
MVPPPLHSLCCIAGTIVQRTVTGAVAWGRRLKGAATASRMQLRRCGGRSGRGTDDVDRTVRGGRSSLEPRTAPSGDAADHIVALVRAGPMGRTARPHPANRADPLYGLRDGTPDTRRAQPDHIYRDRLRLRQSAVKYPRPENRPLRLDRQVPGQKFVIANSSGLITARIVGTRSTPICIPAVH